MRLELKAAADTWCPSADLWSWPYTWSLVPTVTSSLFPDVSIASCFSVSLMMMMSSVPSISRTCRDPLVRWRKVSPPVDRAPACCTLVWTDHMIPGVYHCNLLLFSFFYPYYFSDDDVNKHNLFFLNTPRILPPTISFFQKLKCIMGLFFCLICDAKKPKKLPKSWRENRPSKSYYIERLHTDVPSSCF